MPGTEGRTDARRIEAGLLPARRRCTGIYAYLEDNAIPGAARQNPRFRELSHGESFLEVLRRRFDGSGSYALGEPRSALSFRFCVALVGVLHDFAGGGTAQALVAHSPVGGGPRRADPRGPRPRPAGDRLGRPRPRRPPPTFLDNPDFYLRHGVGGTAD